LKDKKQRPRRLTKGEERFLRVVEVVCARPAMYVFTRDFFLVTIYLEGYIRGLFERRKLKKYPFGGLLTLLENTDGFSNPAWGWRRHYLHQKESDEKAIRDFPTFLRAALTVPDSHIEEMDKSKRRLMAKRPPVSPQTAKYPLSDD